MKTDVFERLAKKYSELYWEVHTLRQLGEHESASYLFQRRQGILEAVEALGLDEQEFKEYYRANRSRIRKEFFEKL